MTRPTASEITDDQLDALHDERDLYRSLLAETVRLAELLGEWAASAEPGTAAPSLLYQVTSHTHTPGPDGDGCADVMFGETCGRPWADHLLRDAEDEPTTARVCSPCPGCDHIRDLDQPDTRERT